MSGVSIVAKGELDDSQTKGEVVDVAYDIYGKRMATVSADNSVKVWDQDGDGQWQCSAGWTAHRKLIRKVEWAHPEYGQVIATCSDDGDVCIWTEELQGGEAQWGHRDTLHGDDGDRDPPPVLDMRFAPERGGLRLAAVTRDGRVSMYESRDVMSAGEWTLENSFAAAAAPPSPGDESVASLCWRPTSSSAASLPPYLAVANHEGARLWMYREAFGRWEAVTDLGGPTKGAACAIAWARSHGRDVDLVSLGRGVEAEVWRVSLARGTAQLDASLDARLPHGGAPVWRTEWNLLGTTLATSADDGRVRLWRCGLGGGWVLHTSVEGDPDADAAMA